MDAIHVSRINHTLGSDKMSISFTAENKEETEREREIVKWLRKREIEATLQSLITGNIGHMILRHLILILCV